MNKNNMLFTLRVPLHDGTYAMVYGFDANDNSSGCMGVSGARVDICVRHNNKTIFGKGQLYIRTPIIGTHGVDWSLDGDQVKERVLSCVGMKPGDTDEEFFANYTKEQLAWVCKYAEDISCVRMIRYCCDECGDLGKDHKHER